MDTFLVLNLNNFANNFAFVEWLVILVAKYLPYLLMLFLGALIFWPEKNISMQLRKNIVFALAGGLLVRFTVKPLIALFYVRPRPTLVLDNINLLIESDSIASFPSGHALFFFALYTLIFLYNRKLGWIFFTAAFLMGMSRIMAGVHWPSDILGGAILGILGALAINWLVKKYYLWYK